MSDLLASPGEVIRDHAGSRIATVARPIYKGSIMEPEDFSWPADAPIRGARVHPAIEAFIAKKLRLAA